MISSLRKFRFHIIRTSTRSSRHQFSSLSVYTMTLLLHLLIAFAYWHVSAAYEIYNTEDQIAEESFSSSIVDALPVAQPLVSGFQDDSRLNGWLDTNQPILAGVSPPSTLERRIEEHHQHQQESVTADASLGTSSIHQEHHKTLATTTGEAKRREQQQNHFHTELSRLDRTDNSFSTSAPGSTGGGELSRITTIPSTTATTDDPFAKILPLIEFSCKNRNESYYADQQFCDIFHLCKSNGYRFTFMCPRDTVYSLESKACEQNSQLLKQCGRRAVIEVTQNTANISSYGSDDAHTADHSSSVVENAKPSSFTTPTEKKKKNLKKSASNDGDSFVDESSFGVSAPTTEPPFGQRRFGKHPENILSTTTLISPTLFEEASRSDPIHESFESEENNNVLDDGRLGSRTALFSTDFAEHKSVVDAHSSTTPSVGTNTVGTTTPITPTTTAASRFTSQTSLNNDGDGASAMEQKNSENQQRSKQQQKQHRKPSSFSEFENLFNDLDMSNFDLDTSDGGVGLSGDGVNDENMEEAFNDITSRRNPNLRPPAFQSADDGFGTGPHHQHRLQQLSTKIEQQQQQQLNNFVVQDPYHQMFANSKYPSGSHLQHHHDHLQLQPYPHHRHHHRHHSPHRASSRPQLSSMPETAASVSTSSSSSSSSSSQTGSLSNSLHKLIRQSIPAIYLRTVPKLFRTLNTFVSSSSSSSSGSSSDPMRVSSSEISRQKVDRDEAHKAMVMSTSSGNSPVSASLDPETEMSMLSIPVLVPMSLSQDDYRRRMSASMLKPTVIPLREKGKMVPAYVLQFAARNKHHSQHGRYRRSAPSTMFQQQQQQSSSQNIPGSQLQPQSSHQLQSAIAAIQYQQLQQQLQQLPQQHLQQHLQQQQQSKRGLLGLGSKNSLFSLLKLRGNKSKNKPNMQMSSMDMAYASNNVIPFYTLPIFPTGAPIHYQPKQKTAKSNSGNNKNSNEQQAKPHDTQIEILHPVYQMMNDPFYGPYRPFPSKLQKIKLQSEAMGGSSSQSAPSQTSSRTVNGTISLMPISAVLSVQPATQEGNSVGSASQTPSPSSSIVYGTNYAPFPMFPSGTVPPPLNSSPPTTTSQLQQQQQQQQQLQQGVVSVFPTLDPMFYSPMLGNGLMPTDMAAFKPLLRKVKQYRSRQQKTSGDDDASLSSSSSTSNFSANANVYVPDDIIDDSDYSASNHENHRMNDNTNSAVTSGKDEEQSSDEETLNTDESQLSPIDVYRKSRRLDERWQSIKKSPKKATSADSVAPKKTRPLVRITPDIMLSANVFNGTAQKSSNNLKHRRAKSKVKQQQQQQNNAAMHQTTQNEQVQQRQDEPQHGQMSETLTIFRFEPVSTNVTSTQDVHDTNSNSHHHHHDDGRPSMMIKDSDDHVEHERGRPLIHAHHLSGFVKHWHTDAEGESDYTNSQDDQNATRWHR